MNKEPNQQVQQPPGEPIENIATAGDEPVVQQPNTEPEIINPQSEIDNMEVHHHAHHNHGKKTWKHYFWEFFMLFLAVFCGSIAELQLEHYIEHQREKKYIASMIKELKADSAQLAQVFKDSGRIQKMDTLSILLLTRNPSQETIKNVYRLTRSITQYSAMSFNRNTLTQLKSSGNMRLIRNQNVVDSLNKLDNGITILEIQKEAFVKFSLDNSKELYSILDYSYYVKNGVQLNRKEVIDSTTLTYLTTDERKVIEFGGKVTMQKSILINYFEMLKTYSKRSNSLIVYLQKEYHLTNE